MAKVEKSFEAVCDFMARDQFLEACSRELFVHLKPKAFENLDAMAKEADLFAEARGGVFSCVNKGQRDNNKGAAQSKPESKPSGKPEIKCGICGTNHLTIRCLRIPIGNKRIVRKSLVEVAEVREVTLITAVRMSMERRLSLKKANPVEVVVIHVVAVEVIFMVVVRPRGGGHQMSFCKTEVNRESDDWIESIYQSKIDSSLNSDSKIKEGVCYFLKSRLPTA